MRSAGCEECEGKVRDNIEGKMWAGGMRGVEDSLATHPDIDNFLVNHLSQPLCLLPICSSYLTLFYVVSCPRSQCSRARGKT